MARQYGTISRMVNREADKTVSGRVTEDERTRAMQALNAAGWTMPAFVVACVRAVGSKPAEVLALIEAHRATRNPRGRPRKRQP